MGDRGNILIKEEEGGKIYLYTHWDGSNLKSILKKSLKRGQPRWDDESYLTRIIFSEMIKDDILEETGYGISTWLGDGDDKVWEVNMKEKTIKNKDKEWTFSKFVQ